MKWKLSILLFLFVFLTVSTVCAVDVDNSTHASSDDALFSLENENKVLSDNLNDEKPDVPDLIVNEEKHVNPSNINMYFKNGVLSKEFKGETLIFSGNFDDLGVLSINHKNVNVIGENAHFKNTVFNIQASEILLKNLTFTVDKSIRNNNGAVIQVNGYDVTLDSLDINYMVPNDVEAYAVLSDGYNGYSSENLKILNSNIYFEGHNDNIFRYNCAIKLTYANSPRIENNTISSSLPLKKVRYGGDGATLDSDYVYAVGLEESPDFIIKNNTIIVDVNKRTAVEYPTLNAIMLSKSDNGLFLNNSLYMADFVTSPGIENYLYGLDIYKLNNLLVMGNKISIITTGGKLALGTAYPIQVCGPISGINITQNDLYSFSNGPNIGIYSQNYYGETQISITNNRINVTGLAGTHEWALVTGIESQDTNAEILNNIIEVHSVGEVNEDDNLYAISYRQSTAYLLSSDNSIIYDNTLISSNENAVSGSDSYREGPRGHDGDDYSNNKVINERDYYGHENSININSYDNTGIRYIDGRGIGWNNQNQETHNYNPLVPSYSNNIFDQNNEGSGIIDEYHDDGTIQGTITDKSGNNLKPTDFDINDHTFESDIEYDVESSTQKDAVNGKSNANANMNSIGANANSNSSDATPSVGTDNPLSNSQSGSSNAESQSVSKSYEIKEIEEK